MQRLRRIREAATIGDGSFEAVDLHPAMLRFGDRGLESAFRAHHFRHNLTNLRIAHLAGIGLWVLAGLVLHDYLLPSDPSVDLAFRYGVFIPILLIGLGLSFTPFYPRIWEWSLIAVLGSTMVGWVVYVSEMRTMPPDFGYVGLILITAFTYSLIRMRFVVVVAVTGFGLLMYLPYAVLTPGMFGLKVVLATFYLLSFGGLGCITAYRLERFTRLLFLRERQLDREHRRSDALLLNILPGEIVGRLKVQESGARLAEALDEVTVLFADAVGFTEQAAKTAPGEIVEALDGLFRRFDDLADRYGLEKIKTVGDAYMAVAGAPVPRADHVAAAAEMALAILDDSPGVRWPSGDPIVMRIGVATGPAVAGVIGQRKFAYDLWGDTVNIASRLESYAEPGRILVSEEVSERLAGRYEFGPALTMELKGKGPTRVRFLLERRVAAGAS